MAYQVEILPAAMRSLKGLPRPALARIGLAIDALAQDPRPPGAKKMAGIDDAWRIRVGNYRVVYEIHDRRLVVFGGSHRRPQRRLS